MYSKLTPAPGTWAIISFASLVYWVLIKPSVIGAADVNTAAKKISTKPPIRGIKYGLKKGNNLENTCFFDFIWSILPIPPL